MSLGDSQARDNGYLHDAFPIVTGVDAVWCAKDSLSIPFEFVSYHLERHEVIPPNPPAIEEDDTVRKNRRILLLSDEYPPFSSGIATYAEAVASGLMDRGFDVHVLCNRREWNPRDIRSLPSHVHLYDRPLSKFRSSLFLILELPRITRKWIAELDVEEVLIIDPINALPIPLTNRPRQVRHHVVLHGSEIRRYAGKWLTRTLLAKSLGSAATVLTTTGFVDDELFDHFQMRGVRTSCGVRREFFQSDRDQNAIDSLRERYGIDRNAFIAGTICRLDHRKGHGLVLRAIAALADSHPQLHYVIGGEGEEAGRIEELANELDIHDRVTVAGRIDEKELITHYDLFDVFVMPDRLTAESVEGFGISFVEAAARGVPSIGVDNGGVREAVADGVSGILLPDATAENVQLALGNVITKKVDFDEEPIRSHAAGFRWEHVVERIVKGIAIS